MVRLAQDGDGNGQEAGVAGRARELFPEPEQHQPAKGKILACMFTLPSMNPEV
jgi:hypothetical protein